MLRAPRPDAGTVVRLVAVTALALTALASPAAAASRALPAGPATGPLFAPLWQVEPATHGEDENEVALEARGLSAESSTESAFFRRMAGGDITPEAWQRMWADALARGVKLSPTAVAPTRVNGPAQAEAVNAWQLIGPNFSTNPNGGLMTGRVRDIDPVHVRVLAASGGLWRFNILTAIPMSDAVPASWFGAFASKPGDPNVIVLGTGEWQKQSGTGLYRTTDGGVTWTHLSPAFSWCSRIRWTPDGASVYVATNSGVYRSNDDGVSWTRVLNANVSDLTLTPGLGGRMFAAVANQGVYFTADGGSTWSLSNGTNAPLGPSLGSGSVTAVADPNTGQPRVFAAFGLKIWRSVNAGASWTEVTPGNFVISNSTYGPAISVCPNDPDVVLYGNVGFARSSDGGLTWTSYASPHLHADYHVFAWDANGVGVWAGHDGGWSHSLDRGLTWSSSNNVMPVTQFYDVDCVHDGPGIVIGGTQDNNIVYTQGTLQSWIEPAANSTEGDASSVAVDPYGSNRLWAAAGIAGGAIAYPRMRSVDGGTTWTNVSGSLASSSGIDDIVHDNAFPVRLFTSVDTNVFESTDGGNTWGLATPVPFTTRIDRLRASTRVAGGAVLYATLQSFTGDQLFVRDNGVWYERSAGLGGDVVDVVPHPWAANADEAWAICIDPVQRVMHTTNRGQTWVDVTGDLPATLYLSSFVPNPRHTGEWYVGTTLGVWRTTNGGVNWEPWTNGMPPAAIVSDLTYIDQTTSTGQFFVVAATYGRSVWKRDVGGNDVFPTVTVSSPVVQEGDVGQTSLVFRATLSATQAQPCWMTYNATSGTAAEGSDFATTSGTVYFPNGTTVAYFTVPVNGDQSIETDETFNIAFSNPIRLTLPGSATGTILDDDVSDLVCHDLSVTNGTVNAIAVTGRTVYVGGSFTTAGPACGQGVPLDPATGAPLHLPRIDGFVLCAAPDGNGGWYVGGSFTHVGGAPRARLAHLFADGSLDPWNPAPNGIVHALSFDDGMLYVGGEFTNIGGLPRTYLARLDPNSNEPDDWQPVLDGPVSSFARSGYVLYVGGQFTQFMGAVRTRAAAVNTYWLTLTTWNPNASADVTALAVDAGTVFAAGNFTSIGGQTRNYLAALDSTSGLATAWNPAPDNYVYSLAVAPGGPLYVGGAFANIGGQARARLVALSIATGVPAAWNPAADGAVTALALDGGTLYASGSFGNIGGQARSSFGAVSTTSGLATAWNPGADGGASVLAVGGGAVFAGGSFNTLGGQPRGSIAAYDAVTGALLDWNPNVGGTVNALAAGGGVVYAGGSFTTAGGQPRNRLAAFDSTTAAVTAWDPNASSTVRCLLLVGSRLYVGGQFTSVSATARNRVAAVSTGGTLQSWNPNANGTVFALATDGSFVYPGGSFTSIGGQARNGLAQLNTTSGLASAWNPNVAGSVQALLCPDASSLYVGGSFTTIAGLGRPNCALINLGNATVSSWAPAPDGAVSSFAPAPVAGQVYVGGSFTTFGGQPRRGVALVRPSTSSVATWAPQPDDNVNALASSGGVLWIGGSFTSIGALPKRSVACAIQQSEVDVPVSEPPAEFALRVSPNPSAGRFALDYVLPEASRVRVSVYDVNGRRVGAVVDEWGASGAQRTEWNGTARGVGPGVYFVHVDIGRRTAVRRVVIL